MECVKPQGCLEKKKKGGEREKSRFKWHPSKKSVASERKRVMREGEEAGRKVGEKKKKRFIVLC